MENTKKENAKYRTTVYLGKELYFSLQETADMLGISISTLCKILLKTGYEIGNSIERNITGNGKSKI